SLADSQTKKAHAKQKTTITRSINNIVATLISKMNTIIDSNVVLSEMKFSKINILKKFIQIDSSNNDFVISIFFEDYSFIIKKHDKKLVSIRRKISFLLSIEITNILFSEKKVVNEDFSKILFDKEDLSDQDIDFNALALVLENINN
ncbi:10944_t:CDS:1, partial [Cetraspora pellucida]